MKVTDIHSSKNSEDYFWKKNRKKKKDSSEVEESTDSKDYLNIWRENPSFKDINGNFSLAKTISLMIFAILTTILLYVLNDDLIISTSLGILFVVMFIVVFHDEFFVLRNIFGGNASMNPFEGLIFWQDDDEPTILFVSNKKDLSHVAISIFKVEIMPENVHATVQQFIRALSSKNVRVPYSFQVIQKPFITSGALRNKNLAGSFQSVKTSVYFSVYYDARGILTNHKFDKMKYHVKKIAMILKSNFVANFHHYKITLLSDINLITAMRTLFFKVESNDEIREDKREALKNSSRGGLIKFAFLAAFILFFDYALFSLHFQWILIIGINLAIILTIFLTWWREPLFQFTRGRLMRCVDITVVNPFKDVMFYRLNRFPKTLFLHVDNQLLIGVRMVNLKHLYPPPFCQLGRFLDALIGHQISFSYTVSSNPQSYYDFYENGRKSLTPEKHDELIRDPRTAIDKEKEESFLGWRCGIWNSTLLLSANAYKFTDSLQADDFDAVSGELEEKKETLKDTFNINFQNYELVELDSRTISSGYAFLTLKNGHFRLNGTQLNYIMVQGTTLSRLTTVEDVLRRGIETRIATEFNTPLHLENFITIGHAINTEVLSGEVPVGLTMDQLKNLLITNGAARFRELAMMKIASELVKCEVPTLIFDFNGTWSRLLNYFKGTRFERDFLCFKLGFDFTIDPRVSDIPYDTDNDKFLEYMYDAYGLAFKKDKKIIDMFRNTIRRNPEMNLPSIQLEIQTQSEWEKSPISNSLLSMFSDFTQQDLTYFQVLPGEDKVHALDFITNDKSIIIDLSTLREINKKLFFCFLIISKLIHYIESSDTYHEKIIIIPHVDSFFDSHYLDVKMSPDRIDLFLDPLLQHGFGLIFSANQVRYLHANLFTYFNNIFTFKAIDSKDMAFLSNLMNLQELQGKGYYTSARKQTYQISYLKTMKNDEILIKREDIYQPFPARIEWEENLGFHPLSRDEIIEFMKAQGYDLEHAERRILEQARKTLFEIDLGHFALYDEEIINFLDGIGTVDQIGNLYKQRLKDQLLEIIYPKASKRTSNKEHIKHVRDEIFDRLVRHGYLVESHHRSAGGSESTRTSYSIGDRYPQALDDYYQSGREVRAGVDVDVLEKGTGNAEKLASLFQPRRYIIQQKDLKSALMREIGNFDFDIFNIYKFIDHSEYKNALRLEHGLVKRFLLATYGHFHGANHIITSRDLDKFFALLESIEGFPFSKQDLINYVEKCQVLHVTPETVEARVREVYQYIHEFLIKIQQYVYRGK